MRLPSHRCKVCGALWIRYDDTWSLYSTSAGEECCDNQPMEECNIVPLSNPQVVTEDGMVLCYQHARETGTEGCVHENMWPDCTMCATQPAEGNRCLRCDKELHPQWPAVYCSNKCAAEDA